MLSEKIIRLIKAESEFGMNVLDENRNVWTRRLMILNDLCFMVNCQSKCN